MSLGLQSNTCHLPSAITRNFHWRTFCISLLLSDLASAEFSSFCTARRPVLAWRPWLTAKPPSSAEEKLSQLRLCSTTPGHSSIRTKLRARGAAELGREMCWPKPSPAPQSWLLALHFLCHELLHSHTRGQSSKGRAGIGVSNTWDPQGRETLPRIILTFNISGSRISVKWFLLFFWVMSL